jgi:creatinine amidohydrolase
MNLSEMTSPQVDALDRETPVVLPIAALEQHGRHLPVFTDSLLLGEVMRRVASEPISDHLLIAPLQWLGNSHHHMDMPGTMSATPGRYLGLLHDLAESFLTHGFRRIAFINGHGGNITPAQQVAFEIRQKYRQRHDLLLVSLTYWDSADPTELLDGLRQNEMGHAGEWETSMMLALRPDLVAGDLTQIADVPFGAGAAPAYRAWTMPDRSEPGHIGYPAVASAEKGESLFQVFATGVSSFMQRVVAWNGETWNL